MKRTRFIDHQGIEILLIDFSGIEEPQPALDAIAEAKEFIRKQPRQSLLTLTNVRGSKFNHEVAQAVWDLVKHDKPYVRAGAVVGLEEGRQQKLYDLITHMTRRKLELFDEMEEAKNWLVS